MAEDKLNRVIHVRVTDGQYRDLQELADMSGSSKSDVVRMMLGVVEVLFDDELRFADVIKSIPDLKRTITFRRDQSSTP